jgi:hypothetical protein
LRLLRRDCMATQSDRPCSRGCLSHPSRRTWQNQQERPTSHGASSSRGRLAETGATAFRSRRVSRHLRTDVSKGRGDGAGQGSQRFGLAVKIATRCGVRRHKCGREVDSASKTKRPRSLTLWGRFARAALPRGVVLAAGSPEGPQVQKWGALQTSRPRATER